MSTPTFNDGGPAFPVPNEHYPNGEIQYGSNGMSLRDWFAGQESLSDCINIGISSITALLGRQPASFKTNPLGYFRDEAEALAKLKYMRADAMLAVRKERK